MQGMREEDSFFLHFLFLGYKITVLQDGLTKIIKIILAKVFQIRDYFFRNCIHVVLLFFRFSSHPILGGLSFFSGKIINAKQNSYTHDRVHVRMHISLLCRD